MASLIEKKLALPVLNIKEVDVASIQFKWQCFSYIILKFPTKIPIFYSFMTGLPSFLKQGIFTLSLERFTM